MPLSSDVKLPVTHEPIWPAVCIRCGREHPEDAFRFRATRIGWDQIATLGFAFGSRPLIEAPACAACVGPLRRDRRIRMLTSWIVAIPVTFGVLVLLDRFGLLPKRPYRAYAAVGIIILALSPHILWEIIHPLTIDATAKGKSIDYEFRDLHYALLFAELNDGTVN